MRKEGEESENRGEMGGFMGYRFPQCPYIAYSKLIIKYPLTNYIFMVYYIQVRKREQLTRDHQKADGTIVLIGD